MAWWKRLLFWRKLPRLTSITPEWVARVAQATAGLDSLPPAGRPPQSESARWVRPVGYCIQLVHVRGGSKTILGADVADAGARAARHCAVFPGAYIASTLPFPVWIGRLNVPDCSIPQDWREGLGDAVVRLYLDAEE